MNSERKEWDWAGLEGNGTLTAKNEKEKITESSKKFSCVFLSEKVRGKRKDLRDDERVGTGRVMIRTGRVDGWVKKKNKAAS